METFKVQFDEKVTVWGRSTFTVEAESPEEAIEKAKLLEEKGEVFNYTFLENTEEGITPAENGGQCTQAWIINGKTIEKNGPSFIS